MHHELPSKASEEFSRTGFKVMDAPVPSGLRSLISMMKKVEHYPGAVILREMKEATI